MLRSLDVSALNIILYSLINIELLAESLGDIFPNSFFLLVICASV